MSVEQLREAPSEIDKRIREYNNTETWCAETLNGSMRTSFEFQWNNSELIAEDGGSLSEVFDDAISSAEVIVSKNPNLLFELRRRLIEGGEFDEMMAMMRDELPSTMIVISDFPPELMTANEDVGGYNASRRQTMLRVITKNGNSLKITSQSLDGSNRKALEAIYGLMGEIPEEGELLGQRIHRQLPKEWQDNLINNLTSAYDRSLHDQYGYTWHAGIKQNEDDHMDTYQFARLHQDLISWFAEAKLEDPVGAEGLRYKLAATMSSRYESYKKDINYVVGGKTIPMAMSLSPYHLLNEEIETSTQKSILRGDRFSGCGASTTARLDTQAKDQFGKLDYGNKTSESTSYRFDKQRYCVNCQSPPQKGDKKKMCGPCGICRSCDRKLGGKG